MDEDTVWKLSTFKSGLFIWTSTMIRFVRGQLDLDNTMHFILSGDMNYAAAETILDNLNIGVIKSCGLGDDLVLTRTILRIVFIILVAGDRP